MPGKRWNSSKKSDYNKAATRKRKKQKPSSVGAEEAVEESGNSDAEQDPALKKVRWEANDSDGDNVNGEEKQGSEEDEEERVANDKIVLATYSQNFRVGCAYYDPVKLIMCVLEDSPDSSHYDTTKLLLEQVNPDIMLTSSRADEASIDVIREFADTSGGVFQVRPAKEFIPTKGRDRLLSLTLLSELPVEESTGTTPTHSSSDPPANAYDFMQRRRDLAGDPSMKRWNASIRVENFASLESSPLCVSAIGALLDHLAKVRAMADLENEGIGGLEIRAIESICLEHFMQINADALSSLQVFDTESHASVHSDKTKEGLSLYGILNNTRTSLGRFLLRQWLLRPSLSIPVITARHDAVDCLIRPENIVTADAMSGHLKGLKNVPRTLRLLKSGKAGLNDWQGLVKFTFHASLLKEALTELDSMENLQIFKKLIVVLDVPTFREVGNAVHETIDWEESLHAGRVCIRPTIDEELDKWKHIYNGIDGVLSHVATQISETVPADYASSLNVVYFPQLGFLICIPMQESWTTGQGIDVLDGWVFQFSSESHVYFKSEQMHDMDRHIGDLHPSIVDREIEIIQTLLDKILEFEEAISQACDVCAELDCLLCFADASRLYNYRRPIMSEQNVLIIRQGRHPLQEQVVDTFVPNDVSLKGGVGVDVPYDMVVPINDEDIPEGLKSMLIITGANACGKSVYLKQTALIQYMAQIGWFNDSFHPVINSNVLNLFSFVPADSATLGIVDKNGSGLFCGVLRSLLARGPECPKVLAATHFHDVFRSDLLDPELPISFLHMQILLPGGDDDEGYTDGNEYRDRGDEEDGEEDGDIDVRERLRLMRGETITYLYRVAPGLSLDSHAARCAQMFGLPASIVRRAQYVSSLLSTHNLTRLLDEDMSPDEVADLAQAEAVCRRFLAWDLDGTGASVGVKAQLADVLGRNDEEIIIEDEGADR